MQKKALSEASAYEGAMQQDVRSFFSAAAADRLFRYSSAYILDYLLEQTWYG
jgi:hypothetical protein